MSCTVDAAESTASVAESTVPVTELDSSEPRPSDELEKSVVVGADVAALSCCSCCTDSKDTTPSRLPLPLELLSWARTAAMMRQAAVITRTSPLRIARDK
jgi:hypothetical protein